MEKGQNYLLPGEGRGGDVLGRDRNGFALS